MEINAGQDVKPISDFRRATASVLRRLKATRQPVLLTQRGRSVAVLLDVEAYETLEYERRFARAVADGLRDAEQGRTLPHEQVMRDVRKSSRRG